ncbi:hypothetical protein Tsubulata_035864 [Turnera subulata]|uniref:non-specific serine/threonine protein kinase n=1 Tax=Turnera subulata TaxID=218843 RepID=A0A9Q0JNB3_9ROSI|nr:hypothetical protein Tsubulata_035864 [Turnera subulata]
MQTHPSASQPALLDSLPTTSTNSAVVAASDTDAQHKAWHILSVLLSIGRPAPPAELASRCALFCATPDLIRSLCYFPNSPLALSPDGDEVTASLLGFFALKRFASRFGFSGSFTTPIRIRAGGLRFSVADCVRMYFQKRKRIGFESGNDRIEEDLGVLPLSKRIRNGYPKVNFHISEDVVGGSVSTRPGVVSLVLDRIITKESIISRRLLDIGAVSQEESILPRRLLDNGAVCQEVSVDGRGINSDKDVEGGEDVKRNGGSAVNSTGFNDGCNATNDCFVEAAVPESKGEEVLFNCGKMGVESGDNCHPISTAVLDMLPPESECSRVVELESCNKQLRVYAKRKGSSPGIEQSAAKKQSSKPPAKKRIIFGDADASKRTAVPLSIDLNKVPNEMDQPRKVPAKIDMWQKLKQKRDDTRTKRLKDSASLPVKDDVQPKDLPEFEAYIVEEEEGSGGYGTVYRARRKSDGNIVAIKCPHDKAHKHNVTNELKMLERFGGKNFVIKYEGCLKSGNTDCFVLEHVEHDRPEVLKKEIDIFELRWYGYCLFRALASLHKQGIVHRDVKPGNFLFSRKAIRGYLIDFNLAMDLHQKYGTANQSKARNDVTQNHATLSNTKSIPPARSTRFPSTQNLDPINHATTKGSKQHIAPKHVKRKDIVSIKAHNDVLFRSLHQGPKVDVWSAGVTLLYLIIGRSPFYGDPEQNIKDIAKLRGSEDLWEVSKLHDRESSFPMDLYSVQSLPSLSLWDWCRKNTKRQDFLDVIPSSLIDLVDKCLTVNPRSRISAEEALKHDFFAPCHESLRRQRLHRQGLSLDSGTNIPSHGPSSSKAVKIFHQQPDQDL